MNTDNKELYDNLPKGYLKQRRKRDLRYVWSLYAYCVFSVLVTYGILSTEKGTIGSLLFYLIMGINVITMMTSFTNKRIYNNIPMSNHGHIKVFTKKEVLLYALPIVIILPLIFGTMYRYLTFIVPAYVAASVFTRPVDAFDKAKERHYNYHGRQ